MTFSSFALASLVAAAALMLAAIMPGIAAQPSTGPKDPFSAWQAEELLDHPLVGRIWSKAKGGFVGQADLAAAIAKADYLLLGEVHDNPDAHRIQAWGLAEFATARAKGRLKPTIATVMEMLNEAQQPALDKFHASQSDPSAKPDSAAKDDPATALFESLAWANSGWPDQAIYKPILDAAIAAQSRLYVGSAARKKVRQIGKHGFDDMSGARKQHLQLDQDLDKRHVAALSDELLEGHCNMLPKSALPAMVKVQRFRDALMAEAMVKAGAEGGALLIAGNGHVRADRAVPWYLQRMQPGKAIVSLMVLEVSKGEAAVGEYVPLDPDGNAAVDFIVFTPRKTREDQCEELRRMFKKIKDQKAQQKKKK